MILEKKKSARLQIIPISLFLFCSMSALSTVYSSPVKWVACICLLAVAAFMSKTIKWNLSLNTPDNIVFVALICTIGLFVMIYPSTSELYSATTLFLTIFVSFIYTKILPFSDFINIYIKTLRILCIWALLFYILCFWLKISIPHISMINGNGVRYQNWWICVMMERNGGGILNRIMSIFWEPGVFASFLLIGIVFECRMVDRKADISTIIIFCTCLVLTFSTAGYLLFAICICILLFKTNSKIFKAILSVIFIVLASLLVVGYDEILSLLARWNYNVFYKLVEESSSFSTRFFAYEIEWDILKSSNYIGAGLSGGSRMFALLEDKYEYVINARTSTSMMYISSYGILGLVYTLAWIYGSFKLMPGTWIEKAMFVVLMLAIINKEPHNSCLASTTILFYSLNCNSTTDEVILNVHQEQE